MPTAPTKKVPVGIGTIFSYLVGGLGVAGVIVSSAGANLGLSTESIAILTTVIAVATHGLRSWQANKL